jgi:hypothetical protein
MAHYRRCESFNSLIWNGDERPPRKNFPEYLDLAGKSVLQKFLSESWLRRERKVILKRLV